MYKVNGKHKLIFDRYKSLLQEAGSNVFKKKQFMGLNPRKFLMCAIPELVRCSVVCTGFLVRSADFHTLKLHCFFANILQRHCVIVKKFDIFR